MNSPVLFIFYALLAATLDDLGQGLQKGGISWLQSGGFKALWRGQHWSAFRLWLGGVAMCAASPFVLLLALSEGPVNLTAALSVFGLIPLYLYASWFLGEKITREHQIGLSLILISTSWIGWRSLQFELPASQFRSENLSWVLLLGLGSSVLWSVLALWWKSHFLGFALGTLSGVLGGMNLLVLKWGALFEAWWTTGTAWFLLAVASFVVLQFAHTRSKALQVLSANTAISFLFPMLASPFLFSEPVPHWLLLGLVPACVAVACLAQGERKSKLLSQSK